MKQPSHKHAAIFANEVAARNVMDKIQQANFADTEVFILDPAVTSDKQVRSAEGNTPMKTVIRDAVFGATGGAIGGTLASVAATSLKVVAFVGHPVLAGLVAIGYTTLIGGTSGAIIGDLDTDDFVTALEQAIHEGHWVIIVNSRSTQTDQQVGKLLNQSFTEEIYEDH